MGKDKNKFSKIRQITTSHVTQDGVLFEMVYDHRLHETSFVRWQNGVMETGKYFNLEDGSKLEPYSPYNPLLFKKLILFPGEASGYGSTQDLQGSVRSFIHRYVDLTDTFELIASYYVLLTWVFDQYNELPYLRVRGDYGSGKTRFLKTVGSLCYKPIFASGASTVAPIFHILNQVGGTLILDEGDFRFSDEKAEIAKILNNGNAKGFPVLRCQKINQREFTPVAYEVFGPKIVSSRNDYEDKALESRFICEDVGLRKVRKGIPITLPESFDEEARNLRNQLLLWRFENHGKVGSDEDKLRPGIDWRLNQIYYSLLSLVDNEEDKKKILSFAKVQYAQSKVDAGQLIEARVLAVIRKIDTIPEKYMSISEITHKFIEIYAAEYERKITHRFVGSIVRKKLRLKTRKHNGTYILCENQKEKLSLLYQKYDV